MANPNNHREPVQQYRHHIEERIAGLRSRQAALEQLINSLTAYAQCGGPEFDLKYARPIARRSRVNRSYPR